VKQPVRKGKRYRPRGQPYEAKRRKDVPQSSRGDPTSAKAAHAGKASVAPTLVSVSPTPLAADAEARAVQFRPPFYPPFQWRPRESVVIPVLLTLAALALIRQFPAEHFNPTGAAVADVQHAINPGAVAAQTPTEPAASKAINLTRIALLQADGVETVAGSRAPAVAMSRIPLEVAEAVDVPVADVAVRDVGHIGAIPMVRACAVQDGAPEAGPAAPIPASEFGSALAAAAEAQTRDFVVYDDEYRVIQYPGGDVAPLYGVCTDVVIRAYRALGIDLQRLVHESQAGSSDTNISHRRTVALRRFFAKAGASLPITDFPEDYEPGDVVTYHRPQNRGSNDHIAIVSNVTGPSGRPMIVHNRGFGPQVEDALFVNEMTGHYRFSGPAAGTSLAAPVTKAARQDDARPSRRISNSVARVVRRAAALRAAKSAPKL
jgi:uncharacterized protein YijF (DUF1287 family)